MVPRMMTIQSSMNVATSKLAYRPDVLDAAVHRNVEVVQQFLSLGFPINSDLNDCGWTLLHVAAHNGDLEMLELLVRLGAALNIGDYEEKWSPVMLAAVSDQPQAVKYLVNAGADMRIVDCQGRTAEDLARLYKCQGVSSLWSEGSSA
jgi:ankyrin repeat protein